MTRTQPTIGLGKQRSQNKFVSQSKKENNEDIKDLDQDTIQPECESKENEKGDIDVDNEPLLIES